MRFEATDDLRDHLKLDPKKGTVQLFHQTAVLKEHLLAIHSVDNTATISELVRRYVDVDRMKKLTFQTGAD